MLSHLNQCRLVARCRSVAAFMRLGAEHGIRVHRSMVSETGNARERGLAAEYGAVLISLSFRSLFVPLEAPTGFSGIPETED